MAQAVLAEFIVPSVPDEWVLDEAQVLSEDTETEINRQLKQFEAETSTQILVVTLQDLKGYTIEEVALKIGREWGVGQEEFDNGIVFLIAPNEQEARIEVGRGLEGIMPDTIAYAILEKFVIPQFAKEDYNAGVIQGVYYIVNVVANENFDTSVLTEQTKINDFLEFFAGFGMIFFWMILSFMSQSRSWWAGGLFGGLIAAIFAQNWWIIISATLGGLLLDYIVSTFFYRKIKNTVFGSLHGGGRSNGGNSKGGFIGGGGSFGGGGASGRW